MTSRQVGIAILAAGGSRRMGQPKQLLPFRDRTLLRRAAETAVASVCRPVVVVTGAYSERVSAELEGLPITIAYNADWASGIASSLRVAVRALGGVEDLTGVVIALSDQPLVTADALNTIVETHDRTGKDIVASEYADTFGVPLLIARRLFNEVAALDGDEGARSVIARHLEDMTTVPLADAAFDVDTTVDYERLMSRSGH